MKRKTRRLMNELGPTRLQKGRYNYLEEQPKKFPARKRSSGIKKNFHMKHSVIFETGGRKHLKFIKLTPLTGELKRMIGSVAAKLPKAETSLIPGNLALLSVWYDTKNNQIILRHDGIVKHEDILGKDELGNSIFINNEQYAEERY